MSINKSLFSSATPHWATPPHIYDPLNAHFHFTDDPCPLHGEGGLSRRWGKTTFVNPPYGHHIIDPWMQKAAIEGMAGNTVVCLVPARTDTDWFQSSMRYAREVLFLDGRIRFLDDAGNPRKSGAPFPSAIVLFGEGSLSGFAGWGFLVKP